MSKYAGGLSTKDVCELEIKDMEAILDKYNVSKEDKATLKDMLEEAYFQLSQAYTSGRVLERHLCKDFSFQDYIKEYGEENKNNPFFTDGDDEDGE